MCSKTIKKKGRILRENKYLKGIIESFKLFDNLIVLFVESQ